MSDKTGLYRHFDKNNILLYVGVSLSVARRTKEHLSNSAWAYDVVKIDTVWFNSRADALMAEREAIRGEAPIYNKAHVAIRYDSLVMANDEGLPDQWAADSDSTEGETINELVNKLLEAGYTQVFLANEIDMNQSTISKVKTGEITSIDYRAYNTLMKLYKSNRKSAKAKRAKK